MASGPITLQQIGKRWKQRQMLSGSRIAVDGDCNHEIKWHLLLGRKDVTLDESEKGE